VTKPLYRSTFYLLEGIAALLLFGTLFQAMEPLAVLGLALILGGLRWNRARQASWFVIVLISLVGLAVHPTHMEGYVLGLAGVYLLFNSGLWGDKPLVPGVVVVVLASGCQIAGLVLAWEHWETTLLHLVAADLVLATLVIVYRKQLMGIEPQSPRPLPVLNVAEQGLTSGEVEILRLFAKGRNSKEVAADLGKSDSTVRTSLSQIYRKLGVPGGKELLTLLHGHRVVYGDGNPPVKHRF